MMRERRLPPESRRFREEAPDLSCYAGHILFMTHNR